MARTPAPSKQAILTPKRIGKTSATYWIVLDGARVGTVNVHTHRSLTGKSLGHTVIWMR